MKLDIRSRDPEAERRVHDALASVHSSRYTIVAEGKCDAVLDVYIRRCDAVTTGHARLTSPTGRVHWRKRFDRIAFEAPPEQHLARWLVARLP